MRSCMNGSKQSDVEPPPPRRLCEVMECVPDDKGPELPPPPPLPPRASTAARSAPAYLEQEWPMVERSRLLLLNSQFSNADGGGVSAGKRVGEVSTNETSLAFARIGKGAEAKGWIDRSIDRCATRLWRQNKHKQVLLGRQAEVAAIAQRRPATNSVGSTSAVVGSSKG